VAVGRTQQFRRDAQTGCQSPGAVGVQACVAMLDRAKCPGWDADLQRKLYYRHAAAET
jgi:hypothetical protein